MITLSSDFGSPYPGAMKGVLLQWTDAQLVDIAHDFPRQNVPASAFWLTQVLPYFPPAVHLAVVDPGVGTDRDAIVVSAGEHALVGPDNGLLVPPARILAADDERFDVYRVAVTHEQNSADPTSQWPPDPASSTFHGRDVFAPVAGRIHEASVDTLADIEGLEPTDEYETLRFPDYEEVDDGLRGEVIAIDAFGNVITNVPGETIESHVGTQVRVNDIPAPVRRTYAAVDRGERVVTIGSHGNVEFAVNQARGEVAFGLSVGDTVHIDW